MSQLADGHDNFCNCKTPFAHLLASIFPPGHKDRDLSINQILLRDYRETCHSGGEEETNHGTLTTTELTEGVAFLKEEEGDAEYIRDEDLQKLIDAGEDAEGTR